MKERVLKIYVLSRSFLRVPASANLASSMVGDAVDVMEKKQNTKRSSRNGIAGGSIY